MSKSLARRLLEDLKSLSNKSISESKLVFASKEEVKRAVESIEIEYKNSLEKLKDA